MCMRRAIILATGLLLSCSQETPRSQIARAPIDTTGLGSITWMMQNIHMPIAETDLLTALRAYLNEADSVYRKGPVNLNLYQVVIDPVLRTQSLFARHYTFLGYQGAWVGVADTSGQGLEGLPDTLIIPHEEE